MIKEIEAPKLQGAAIVELPSFVFQIAVWNRKKNEGGFGNAVLIDKSRGVFITNAHIVDAYRSFKTNELRIGTPLKKVFHVVECQRSWINWDADLALVRLKDVSVVSSCAIPTMLRMRKTDAYERILVAGYLDEDPLLLDGRIVRHKQAHNITLPSATEMLRLERQWFVSREDRSKLYNEYVWFHLHPGKLYGGMSGSALITPDEHLVGIVSRAIDGGDHGLAVPSHEIEQWAAKKMI